VYAHEAALAHFQRSLAARGIPLTGTEPAPDAEAAELLFGLGRAQVAAVERDQLGASLQSLSRAFEFYENSGDVERVVAVAEYPFLPPTGQHSEATQLITRALGLMPEGSVEAGRLLSRLGRFLGVAQGDYERFLVAFDKALAIAMSENDTALEMDVLTNSARMELAHLNQEQGLTKGLKAIELANRSRNLNAEVRARTDLANALAIAGDSERARLHAKTAPNLAERLRSRSELAVALRVNMTISRLEGGWGTAREFCHRGLAVSRITTLLGYRSLMEYELGNFDQGATYLEEDLQLMYQTPPGAFPNYCVPAVLIPLVAQITGEFCRLDAANAANEIILNSPRSTPLVTMFSKVSYGLQAVLATDRDSARELYLSLQSNMRLNAPGTIMSGDRLLGLLAHTIGNLDQAMTHFEGALAFCRGAGYRPEFGLVLL
jgi:tetratricopeptide (TPR) repeat protein